MDPSSLLLLAMPVLAASLGLVVLAVVREGWWDRRRAWAAERLRSFAAGAPAPASSGESDRWLEATAVLGAAAAEPNDQGWVRERLRQASSRHLRFAAVGAVESLGREGGAADRPDLQRRRRWVGNLLILQQNPAPELLEVLVAALFDPDPVISGAAALAVGRHPGCYPGAAVPLAAALREAAPPAQPAQAWCLAALLDSHPSLAASLADDPAAEVRRLAVRAAGRYLGRGATGGELAASLAAVIEGAAADAEAAVRREAQAAVRHLDGPWRRPISQPALADPAPAVRRAAVETLAAGGEGSVAALVAALPAAGGELRSEILTALEARPGDAGGVPEAVRSQAEEGSATERRWAVEALGCLGGAPEVEWLATLLDADDADLRAAACGSLAAIARRGAVGPALAAVLPALLARWPREEDPRALVDLAEALGRSGRREAETAILTRLSSVAAPLRERLLEILARFERDAAGLVDV